MRDYRCRVRLGDKARWETVSALSPQNAAEQIVFKSIVSAVCAGRLPVEVMDGGRVLKFWVTYSVSVKAEVDEEGS